ncbi:MAG: hypothetical protein DWQ36_13315 [Acidobacteria bacterium]|nr:MAG: hypothetical protein DWQ30_05625 [Acidobacteriota bacterium]REK06889.1 MAG: hypothetical protein DWQ36_13315 [Acidobacteriota bacterium]
MNSTRREASRRCPRTLSAAGGALLALVAGCAAPSGDEDSDPEADSAETVTETPRERMARVIREYDAQGIHRTGTEVDDASARWFADLVREAGFEPQLEELTYPHSEFLQAELRLADGSVVEGIPLFDGGATGAEGVRGVLREVQVDEAAAEAPLPADAPAAIFFARIGPLASYAPGFRPLREHPSVIGLVAVTGGAELGLPEGYSLINANRYLEPYGAPALQVESQAWETLAAHAGQEVELVIEARRSPRVVYNVLATVPGSAPGLAPVVVMTPRSGWWQCASERGGGIAVWVELLHALRQQPPARSVHFVASTGHELGHVGLDHHLAERPELIAGAHLWLHLGANFAAATAPGIRLQASSQELFDDAAARLQAAGAQVAVATPIDQRPLGEARNIHDGGGRFVSILGGNGLFHSPQDRWPDAVDLDVLESVRAAIVGLVQAQAPAP